MHSESPHILQSFDKALQDSRARILMMASITKRNLHNAMKGLMERDINFCNQAIADDDEIDQLEKDVDRDCMNILIRYHPIARDLRQILSSMKMATNLERISDLATGIAKRARKMIELPEVSDVNLVEAIYMLADSLLDESISAFADNNHVLAESIPTKDQQVDKAHKKFNKTITKVLESDSANARSYIYLVIIARNLERIGDHAVNIAEEVVFMEKAQDIRHPERKKKEEGPEG